MDYIVATKGKLYCIYREGGGLFWRQYADSKWSDATCIKREGVTKFSASLCEGRVLILCQNDSYVERIVFDGGVATISPMVSGSLAGTYHGIDLVDDIYVVHNIAVAGEASEILMSHNVSDKGLWTNSRHLGRIVPFDADTPFCLVPVHGQHYLVFYQAHTAGSGADLGFREVYGATRLGELKVIQPGANINSKNFSFLASPEAVHMVYTTKSMLNTSLVYRKFDATGLSPRVIVPSGQHAHSPLVFTRGDATFITFMRSEQLFEAQVQENGSISPPSPKSYSQPKMSVNRFLQDDDTKHIFATNEVYSDIKKPWDIQLFTEIYSFAGKTPQPLSIGTQEEYGRFFDEMKFD